MSLLDDIKSKADANGDGKLSPEDLEDLRGHLPDDKLNQLKEMADQNDDGKLDFSDVQNFNFDATLEDLKGSIGGLFGK